MTEDRLPYGKPFRYRNRKILDAAKGEVCTMWSTWCNNNGIGGDTVTYKILKPAPTLKDLRDRIDEAIQIAGLDAEWNGFDDGKIYIHSDDISKWVSITPMVV